MKRGSKMTYEDDDISSKSQMVTLLLLLFIGSIGAHRFYVKKYFTGILFLVFGIVTLFLDYLGLSFAIFFKIIFNILIIIDLHALYSDSFTDKKGLLVLSKSKTLIYESYEERDRIEFEEKLNKVILILLTLGLYIAYFVITTFVL
jgi:TM2 domain-containing membrane protein YozV